jgi:hypothetical protein
MQGPSLQLPWWDSQLFGSGIIALMFGVGHWLSSKKQNKIQAAVDENKAISEDTHTLVNSQMGTALKVNVATLTALYEVTRLPEHLALLNEAKQTLADHDRKQALVDAGKEAT